LEECDCGGSGSEQLLTASGGQRRATNDSWAAVAVRELGSDGWSGRGGGDGDDDWAVEVDVKKKSF